MSGGFVVWACFACLNHFFELLKSFFVLGFFCCVRSCRCYYHPDRIIFYTIYVRKIINTNINTKLNTKLNTTLNIGIFGITYKKYNDHPRRDITKSYSLRPTIRVHTFLDLRDFLSGNLHNKPSDDEIEET